MSWLGGGGAEKVLCDVLNRFDYAKYEVDLCLLSYEGIYLADLPEQVKVIPLYKNRKGIIAKLEHRFYRHFRISLLESFRIKRKISKQYSVIISFLEGEPLKFHNYVASRAKKNLSWVHTDMLKNYNTVGYSLSVKDELKAYMKMDEIIFVSNDALDQFKKRFTIKAKHQVIYNLVDCYAINKASNNRTIIKKRFTVCTIGRLSAEKAVDRFIRVAKKFKNEGYDIDFWIIGNGKLKNDLVKLRDSFGLKKEVHFFGFQKPPYPWLKKSDIFVSTSKIEGFSLVVCEALCLGKPIVATKCTGPMEILENNRYGVLTEQDDDSIYQGIKSLVDNKDLLVHYQKMANERAKIFDIPKTMNKIYSFLGEN